MGATIDTSHCRKEEHTHGNESAVISGPSVDESEVFPKAIAWPDSNNVLTQTSNTQRKTLIAGGIGPAMEDIEGYSTDSGSDANKDAGPKQHGVSERRRAQNARFNSWWVNPSTRNSTNAVTKATYRLASRAERVTKEEVKAAVASASDDELSIRTLMSKQESTVIITDPREYQVELFEKAKKQNIIAVLDTGL